MKKSIFCIDCQTNRKNECAKHYNDKVRFNKAIVNYDYNHTFVKLDKTCECCGKPLKNVHEDIRYCHEHMNEYKRRLYLKTHLPEPPKVAEYPIKDLVDKFINEKRESLFSVIEEYTQDYDLQDSIFRLCSDNIVQRFGKQFFDDSPPPKRLYDTVEIIVGNDGRKIRRVKESE
jgi:hypothetical protein